jgi:hypothetical protein
MENTNEKIIMSELDNISLRLMCNKSKYNKLLSKTNPEAYNIKKMHNDKLKKYSKNILYMVNEYLSNTNTEISNDLDEAFDNFAKLCINHIEIDKLNQETNGGCYEDSYEDENKEDIDLYNNLNKSKNMLYDIDTALYSSLDNYVKFEKNVRK